MGRRKESIINCACHTTKMAATPIYGKNLQKSFPTELIVTMIMKLGTKHYELNLYTVFCDFFYLLLRRSISDHYLRSCGYVTCSRPQRTATGGLEPGTSRPKVLGFITAPVRSTLNDVPEFTLTYFTTMSTLAKLIFSSPEPKAHD